MKLRLGALVLVVLLMAVWPSAALAQGGGQGTSGSFQQIIVTYDRLSQYTAQGWTFIRETQMWNGKTYIPAALVEKWVVTPLSRSPMLLAPIPAYPLYQQRNQTFCGGRGWYFNPRTGGCSRNF